MGRPKKNKLGGLNQVHGMDVTKPRTLAQAMGETYASKYRVNTEGEYREILADMNLAELQTHALEHELMPIDDRQLLIRRCVDVFKKHTASLKYPESSATGANFNEAKTQLSEYKRLMDS